MRTNFVWFLVLAMGIAALMWGLAGVDSALTGPSATDDLESGSELESQAPDEARVNGSANSNDGESDIVGLILAGGAGLGNFINMAILLPIELQRLGFPQWFAYPIGLGVQVLALVGLIQFVTNRVLR